MFDSDKQHIERVTKAVAALYDRIDSCGDVDNIMADGSDTYDFILDELVDEVVEIVQALYWARENADNFPMKNYGERSDGAKEYMTALNKAIKDAPLKAQTKRIKQNSERLHKIVSDFGEWADNITANPLGAK